jgi:putative heme-binding domain-containing protein
VAALLRAPRSRELLLAALESERVPLAEVEPGAVDALRYLPDVVQRNRIARLMSVAPNPMDRAALVASYAKEIAAFEAPPSGAGRQPLVRATVSDARGAELFARHCMACHQISGHGPSFGPDLAVISSLPREMVIGKTLDPSRDLLPSQSGAVVVTKSGQVLYGSITLETPNAISLRRSDGQDTTLLRSQLAEVHATDRSSMPEGFESILSPADMADLLAFLNRQQLEMLPPEVKVVVEDTSVTPIEEAIEPATSPVPSAESEPSAPAAETAPAVGEAPSEPAADTSVAPSPQ